MQPVKLLRADALRNLPAEWPSDPLPDVLRLIAESGRTVVILDDDPTGTQTVHNVPVLTEWSAESLERELRAPGNCFFILTNSRSLGPREARELNLAIANSLKTAQAVTGRQVVVVSRGDSTLRGHFPLETDALSEILGPFDGVLLVPFYETGRRQTLGDIHYLEEGEFLTPVAETEFARDTTFGYRKSDLREWVEDKSDGRIKKEDIASVSIEIVRHGTGAVRECLLALHGGQICVANIVTNRDLLVFVQGVLEAEALGKRFLYRSAASFAAARGGIVPRGVLGRHELHLPREGGGLIVVGSYVPTSSRQLHELLAIGKFANIELNVRELLDPRLISAEIARAIAGVDVALKASQTIILYTSRELVTGPDPLESLSICRQISEAVVEVVTQISVRPRFVLVKGGITSSGVMTVALRVRRALVLGQVIPGVPVWNLGAESRWPGMTYVSFPGNFGSSQDLLRVVDILESA